MKTYIYPNRNMAAKVKYTIERGIGVKVKQCGTALLIPDEVMERLLADYTVPTAQWVCSPHIGTLEPAAISALAAQAIECMGDAFYDPDPKTDGYNAADLRATITAAVEQTIRDALSMLRRNPLDLATDTLADDCLSYMADDCLSYMGDVFHDPAPAHLMIEVLSCIQTAIKKALAQAQEI